MSDAKKKELIKLLKKDRPKGEKFEHHFAIIEQKKVADSIGALRVDWYLKDKLQGSGSLMFPLERSTEGKSDSWSTIQIGESKYFGLTLDLKSKTVFEMASGFIRRTLNDSKLQDLISLTPK